MSEATVIQPKVVPDATGADIPAMTAIPMSDAPSAGGVAPATESAVLASDIRLRRPSNIGDANVQPADGPATASAARGVLASDCGCGGTCSCGAAKTVQLVYALGRLGHDFGTEARRDAFAQAMPGSNPSPHDPAQIAEYLRSRPFEADSLIWTLNLDATPIYAVIPAGPFAATAYEQLRAAFEAQLQGSVEMVSIPGFTAGSATLLSGQTVPAILPSIRGMFSWNKQVLIERVLGARPRGGSERITYDKRAAGLSNFLSRIYYDLRNLGLTAQERALNFSATNAFQAAQVIEAATNGDLELDTINVRKSPVCRPDSDCYDIEIGFFDPRNVNIATKIFRFTIDVSDVMPVSIGQVRAWSKRT